MALLQQKSASIYYLEGVGIELAKDNATKKRADFTVLASKRSREVWIEKKD